MLQKDLRKKYISIRNALSEEEIASKSELICENVLKLLESLEERLSGSSEKCVLMYYPLNSEVSLLSLYQKLKEKNVHCFFPVTYHHEKDMLFFEPDDIHDFAEGNFHVMEPVSRDEKYHGQPAAVIVPGLVFSQDKKRVGYGAGYYDRFLTSCPDNIKIGVLFECQLSDEIEDNPWDVKMDYLCSESFIKY